MIKIDDKIANRQNENEILIKIMKFFSMLGNYNLIWLLICVVIYCCKEVRVSFYVLVTMLVVFAISSGLFKSLIRRKRPYEKFKDIKLHIAEPYGSSLPSDHAAIGAAVSSVIILEYNFIIGVFTCVLALLISMSRVYLKVNYLTDVIIGGIIGVLCAIMVLHLNINFLI